MTFKFVCCLKAFKRFQELQTIVFVINYNIYLILTLPIAKRPLSNSNNMPKNKNDMPKPAKPTPISVKYKKQIIRILVDNKPIMYIYFVNL